MNKTDQYIKEAIELIKAEGLVKKDGSISKEYKGYIANFGTSVMQCGLIPAVALYSDASAGTKSDKLKIPKIILRLIKPDEEVIEAEDKKKKKLTLINYILKIDEHKREELEEEILEAATALKLALRTFELK